MWFVLEHVSPMAGAAILLALTWWLVTKWHGRRPHDDPRDIAPMSAEWRTSKDRYRKGRDA